MESCGRAKLRTWKTASQVRRRTGFTRLGPKQDPTGYNRSYAWYLKSLTTDTRNLTNPRFPYCIRSS